MKITHPTGWEKFLTLCHQTESNTELEQLMRLLLTHEEQEQIATRVLLLKELLAKEKPQRKIAEELHVSIAKITRGSNALKHLSEQELEALTKYFLNT